MNASITAQRAQALRLIFTVTTGRSGTAFLAGILNLLPGVVGRHEPPPRFSDVMRRAQTEPRVASDFLLEKKLPVICKRADSVYAETSHVFCKGFLEPALELGLRPKLIMLRRPWRKVAVSLCRLGTIPGRTRSGRKWCLSPSDKGVLPLPGWKRLHDYQLCYWYCLEIERRMRAYEALGESFGLTTVCTSLPELNTIRGFVQLARSLSLPAPRADGIVKYLLLRHRRPNTRSSSKRPLEISVRQLVGLERELEELVGLA